MTKHDQDRDRQRQLATDSMPPKAQVQVSLGNFIDTADYLPLGDNQVEAATPQQASLDLKMHHTVKKDFWETNDHPNPAGSLS